MATEAEITNAENAMNNAYAAIAPAYASMKGYYDWLSRCKYEGTLPALGDPAEDIECKNRIPCTTDCCDKPTCHGIVADYNARVVNWENANTSYENAKDYYDNLKSGQQEADTDKDISKIEQEAKLIRTRYYIFAAIVIISIVGGIFLWMKYKR